MSEILKIPEMITEMITEKITEKITDKVVRFDQAVGAPLGSLSSFHTPNISAVMPNDFTEPASLADTLPEGSSVEPNNTYAEKTYADGVLDGQAQTQAQVMREQENQQADIQNAAQNLTQAMQAICVQIEESHGRALTQILQAVLPSLAHKHIAVEIKNFLLQISAPALQGCVSVQAPTHLHTDIEEILREIAAAPSANMPDFKLEASTENDALPSTQISAAWQDGGATIDIEGALEHCLSLLKNNLDNDRGATNGQA